MNDTKAVINTLVDFQSLTISEASRQNLPNVQSIDSNALSDLYIRLLEQCKIESESISVEDVNWVIYNINNKIEVSDINVLVHNYFNSRNIVIRVGGEVAIYDWELAVTGSSLRDLVEFPSFMITDDWSNEQILEMVASHKSRLEKATGRVFEEDKWSNELRQSLIQFIAGRASFYLLGESMLNYGFSQRIFKSAMRMIKMHR